MNWPVIVLGVSCVLSLGYSLYLRRVLSRTYVLAGVALDIAYGGDDKLIEAAMLEAAQLIKDIEGNT